MAGLTENDPISMIYWTKRANAEISHSGTKIVDNQRSSLCEGRETYAVHLLVEDPCRGGGKWGCQPHLAKECQLQGIRREHYTWRDEPSQRDNVPAS